MYHQQRANFELKRPPPPMIAFVDIRNKQNFKASANYDLQLLMDLQQRAKVGITVLVTKSLRQLILPSNTEQEQQNDAILCN